MTEITPAEYKARLDSGDRPLLLDVRNPEELQICRIPDSVFIPLPELARRVGELDKSREVVVHCKSGGRSAKAAEFLREAGFAKVLNMTGGILRYIDEVDPSQPKY